MDNVTHTLFALTLARTRLGRGRGATAALVLASSAPDCDIVAALSGSASYLEWHRGPTHGPLGVVGLGLITAGIVWTGRRLLGRRGLVDMDDAAPFGRLAAISVLGVFAHILMDLPTSYGTRLLSPFSWRWYALDLMPIIDVYLLAALTGGLLLGSRSAGRRRASVAIVLTLMAANYALRGFTHQEALKRADRLFSPTLPRPCSAQGSSSSLLAAWPRDTAPGVSGGRSPDDPASARPCLLETAAIPTFVSPFRWRVIAQLSDAYEIYDIDILDAELRSRTPPPDRLARIAVRIPNHWTTLTHEAAGASNVRVLLGFSRFPQASTLTDATGAATVRFTDMRFAGTDDGSTLQTRRRTLFTATVRIGPGKEILQD